MFLLESVSTISLCSNTTAFMQCAYSPPRTDRSASSQQVTNTKTTLLVIAARSRKHLRNRGRSPTQNSTTTGDLEFSGDFGFGNALKPSSFWGAAKDVGSRMGAAASRRELRGQAGQEGAAPLRWAQGAGGHAAGRTYNNRIYDI